MSRQPVIFSIVCRSLLGAALLFGAFCQSPETRTRGRVCTPACQSGDCEKGAGVYQYDDCGVYRGPYRNGVREGQGVYEFANGDRFKGAYRRDRRRGAGSYHFKNGNVFHGGFSSARFEAPASLVFADGARLSGSFVKRAAREKSWQAGPLASVQAYGTLVSRGGPRRLCASFGRKLLCDTPEYPGRLEGTSLGGPPAESFLLVLYSARDTSVRRDNRTDSGQAGMVLRPGDQIEAGSFSIEIQAASGTVLRLKPGSLLHIPQDFGRSGILDLKRGGILVRTGEDAKKSGAPKLRVRSGGTIYAVNGTEFSVETDDTGRISKVKVYSGEIVLTPDIPSLRRFTPAEIQATPALKKIIDELDDKPVRVKPGQTATLSPAGRQWAESLESALQKQKQAEIRSLAREKPASKGLSRPQAFTETPQEKSERQLLTSVNDERFDEAIEQARGAGDQTVTVDEELTRKIELEYEENLNERADTVSRELSRKNSGARSLEDLQRIYATLEVITFLDGTKKAGSVVAQVGGLLILHSTDGVFRARIADVRYVDLFHREDLKKAAAQDGQKTPSPE